MIIQTQLQIEAVMLMKLLISWVAVAPSFFCSGATIGRFEIDEILSERSQVNRNPLYTTWENPLEILYRFDSDLTYSDNQRQLIRDSMDMITSDMKQCIRFVPWNRAIHTSKDHLVIAKTFNTGAPCETCFSFPGKKSRAPGATGRGQKLCLVDGINGCLNTTELAPVRGREAMKFLVNSLGIRSELNRPDRDQFVDIFDARILPELRDLDLTRKYDRNNVAIASDFDYNSITIPDPFKYTIPGSGPLYQPRLSSIRINFAAVLSKHDKVGLVHLYPTCAATVEGRSSTTSIPTTTLTTTEASSESSTAPPTPETEPPTTQTSVTTRLVIEPPGTSLSTSTPLVTLPPVTEPTSTRSPVTVPTSTDSPVTVPTSTDSPVIVPTSTESPVTEPISTDPPAVTTAISTESPVTEPISTESPLTEAPQTRPPVTGPEVPITALPGATVTPGFGSGGGVPVTNLPVPGQTRPPVTSSPGGEIPVTDLPDGTRPPVTSGPGGEVPFTSLPGQTDPPVTSSSGEGIPLTALPVTSAAIDLGPIDSGESISSPATPPGDALLDVVAEGINESIATGRAVRPQKHLILFRNRPRSRSRQEQKMLFYKFLSDLRLEQQTQRTNMTK